MKKITLFLLAMSLILSLLPMAALATEVEPTEETTEIVREPYQCGEDMEWLYEEGVLTIVGTGEMDDYEKGQAPWEEYKKEITAIDFSGEVTYIGSYAFYDYDALTEVNFGDKLYEIGAYAFYDCDGLTAIHLPATFKIFGERCFSGSSRLAEIHCQGVFPKFKESCLWDVYCKIYFPAERPWGVTYIEQLETAFKGRIEFLASDGSDPYSPEEETETTEPETTETVTEPETTEAPTEAVTEAPTESETTEETVTEGTEQVTTEAEPAPTEPETTEAEETEEETEEVEEESKPASKAWIGVVVVIIVLLVLNLGALLTRRPKGGKYRNR